MQILRFMALQKLIFAYFLTRYFSGKYRKKVDIPKQALQRLAGIGLECLQKFNIAHANFIANNNNSNNNHFIYSWLRCSLY